MIRLTQEREGHDWTRRRLGERADMHPARVGQIENGRVIPYPVELERLARALGFRGDPAGLLSEVADERTA